MEMKGHGTDSSQLLTAFGFEHIDNILYRRESVFLFSIIQSSAPIELTGESSVTGISRNGNSLISLKQKLYGEFI